MSVRKRPGRRRRGSPAAACPALPVGKGQEFRGEFRGGQDGAQDRHEAAAPGGVEPVPYGSERVYGFLRGQECERARRSLNLSSLGSGSRDARRPTGVHHFRRRHGRRLFDSVGDVAVRRDGVRNGEAETRGNPIGISRRLALYASSGHRIGRRGLRAVVERDDLDALSCSSHMGGVRSTAARYPGAHRFMTGTSWTDGPPRVIRRAIRVMTAQVVRVSDIYGPDNLLWPQGNHDGPFGHWSGAALRGRRLRGPLGGSRGRRCACTPGRASPMCGKELIPPVLPDQHFMLHHL